MTPIGLIVIALLSLFIIVKSASYLILGISNYARKTGISDYLIGFVVVSIGTSLPELSTGIMSSLVNKGELILGNVVGASLVDLTLIFGIILLVAGKIKLKKHLIAKQLFVVLAVAVVPLILAIDGIISRTDGLILSVSYIAYIYILARREGELGQLEKDVKIRHIWKDMLIFLGALAALLLSARWLVFSFVRLSALFDFPLYFMGLFFMALCTTMPELTVGIKAIIHNHRGIAIGDLFGAVVTNISFVLGISALINPINVNMMGFFIPYIFLIESILIGIILLRKKEINRRHGLILVATYISFILIQTLAIKVF